MKRQAITKLVNCEQCNKSFSSNGSLNRHKSRVCGKVKTEKITKCDQCFTTLSSKGNLSRHKSQVCGKVKTSIKCSYCELYFSAAYKLKHHVSTIHGQERRMEKDALKKSNQKECESHKPRSCPICMRTFARSWCLKVHMVTHDENQKKKCELCHKIYNHQNSLDRHIDGQIKCKDCDFIICSKRDMEIHKMSHEGKVKLECQICFETFNFKRILRDHEQTHTDIKKPYSCIECQKLFMTKQSAKSCERRHKETYKCGKCNLCFLTNAELIRHKETHNQKRATIECDICHHITFSKQILDRHKYKKHNLNRIKYECDLCEKKLATQRNLRIHKKIKHDFKIRPWICEFCKMQWKSRNTYREHMRHFHIDTFQFKCPFFCTDTEGNLNVFRLEKTLKKHIKKCSENSKLKKVGKNEIPACEDCGKIFKSKNYLELHSFVHTKERNFKCTDCGATFGRKFTLNTHRRNHTGEMPYECNICSKKFKYKHALNRHKVKDHGEERKAPLKYFKCEFYFCQFQTTLKNYISIHARRHTREKPFSCKQCHKKFGRMYILREHTQRVHGLTKEEMKAIGLYKSTTNVSGGPIINKANETESLEYLWGEETQI